ncbi:MAG: DHH family phosphoesterase [Nanoarchaeota archaeon]|nr:DHH family phosphoesterase [Nanoarchaeota archaeon]
MIPEEQMAEFRKLLDESKRPLFFFDDDPDGLCSYLLLKKYAQKGRGVVIKAAPILGTQYNRKIMEYRPDRIFVLDKPVIEQDFIDEAGVQVVWLDHHPLVDIKGAKYFNPLFNEPKDSKPTVYWAYRIAGGPLWLAMAGCIGDWFVPEFAKDFAEKYPKLLPFIGEPGNVLYDTELGHLARILASILKGPTTDVFKCISSLEKIQEPEEILEGTTPAGRYILKYYKKINQAYEKLLQKAMATADKSNFFVFTYPLTKMTFSGDLANELLYRLPGKFIIVARLKQDSVAFSMRGLNYSIPPMLKQALEGLDGYGGGHEHACGGSVSKNDFSVLVERLRELSQA